MTTIDDLKLEYDSLFERENKIDQDLQLLLANQSLNDAKFNSLNSLILKIQMVYKDSQNLSNMINFTSNLADNVSNKVRQLDLAKGRVTCCIKRVQDILDLKACTDGVTEALREEDYESAAHHIHKYLSLDKDSLRLKSSSSDEIADEPNEKSLDYSFKLLQDSKTKLQSIVTERYEQALKANDVPELERFFKIFPLIGLRDEGINRFSTYLCSQIHVSAEKSFNSLVEQTILGANDASSGRWSIIFADALILLFERVARLIEAYQPVIQANYGFGNIFGFMKNIQRECDIQAVRILNKFKETRRLGYFLRSVSNSSFIGSYNRNSNAIKPAEDRIDPRDLDELLTETTLISSRTELYKSFLLKSIIADIQPDSMLAPVSSDIPSDDAHSKAQQEQQLITNKNILEFKKFMNSTQLQISIQEIISHYSALENYFMTENINKAIQMDTVNRNSLTSSVVDDTFFIIKKCIKRCLCSDNVDGCCAMFNNASIALESIYKDYFFSKLKSSYPGGFDLTHVFKSTFQNSDQSERQKVNFLITLNNIEESIECLSTIKKLFEEDISKLFVHESHSSKEKLNSCLSELSMVGTRLKELLDLGFNQLLQNELKPQIKIWCEEYQLINHNINEDELSQYESNDPFIQIFIKKSDQILSSLKENLSSKNQDILTGLMASETANQFELNILKCTFSKYGGLQLDKEIRVLINYLTSLTSWSIREKFARLSQIAILLSLESLNELFDYWNSPIAITWRLTPNEIREILKRRVDFKEEVKSLKL